MLKNLEDDHFVCSVRTRSFVWCGERKKGEKLKYSFVLATTFMEGAIENTKICAEEAAFGSNGGNSSCHS